MPTGDMHNRIPIPVDVLFNDNLSHFVLFRALLICVLFRALLICVLFRALCVFVGLVGENLFI